MAVACILTPRFELLAALESQRGHDGRRALLRHPLALAPEPGAAAAVGEVSGPGEAAGVRAGMALGEALARCPELTLIPPDPERASRVWGGALRRLEGIGAAIESEGPGEAFFEVDGLRGLWGGGAEGVLATARRALGLPARLAVAPTRFCARAAAGRARTGRPAHIRPRAAPRFLARQPVDLLRDRAGADLVEAFERLGIATLGELAALPQASVADRFGEAGLVALRLARGEDERLRPRRPTEPLATELDLPEAISGTQLERGLELLCGRLVADPARRGRTIRRLRLGARLAGGGGWRREAALRRASADPIRLRLALAPRLAELPRPATLLRLEAIGLGPAGGEQLSLADPDAERRARLGEAVRQVRAAAGAHAVLRVLDVDPASRVPERRAVLTPFPES